MMSVVPSIPNTHVIGPLPDDAVWRLMAGMDGRCVVAFDITSRQMPKLIIGSKMYDLTAVDTREYLEFLTIPASHGRTH